jgi:hypothetical protein
MDLVTIGSGIREDFDRHSKECRYALYGDVREVLTRSGIREDSDVKGRIPFPMTGETPGGEGVF